MYDHKHVIGVSYCSSSTWVKLSTGHRHVNNYQVIQNSWLLKQQIIYLQNPHFLHLTEWQSNLQVISKYCRQLYLKLRCVCVSVCPVLLILKLQFKGEQQEKNQKGPVLLKECKNTIILHNSHSGIQGNTSKVKHSGLKWWSRDPGEVCAARELHLLVH